jgi:ATP synthase protein I
MDWSNAMSENSADAMWRGAVIPSVAVSVVSIILATVIRGKAGFWGSLMASVTVIVFFSVHLLVQRLTKDLDPLTTMAMALFSYFTKILIMGGFLFAVTQWTSPKSVDRSSFLACTIAIIIVWLTGEIRAFLKLRLHLPLPPKAE